MSKDAAIFKGFYPEIEPYHVENLRVSALHSIYFEESGNSKGVPVLFVHGGPGGAPNIKERRFFDPKHYRIIIFHQRGCGKSTPHACLEENTTWDLVSDMEKIREHLGIDRWMLFGGSWGSTLSLAYAETHPERVKAMILRGIFMLRKEEIYWFYQKGASIIYPDAWESYLEPISLEERSDMVRAYYERLTDPEPAIRQKAAKAWSIWEGSTSYLYQNQESIDRCSGDAFSIAFARIECHYFINGGFFKTENQLLENVGRIRHIPAIIIQGRYDLVCPMKTAWDLHRAWPEADFRIVQGAGHSAFDPAIHHQLISATDEFRGLVTS